MSKDFNIKKTLTIFSRVVMNYNQSSILTGGIGRLAPRAVEYKDNLFFKVIWRKKLT